MIKYSLVFFLLSCGIIITPNQCKIDKEFKQTFENHLKTIETYETGGKFVDNERYRDAMKYLGIVTDIYSKAEIGSTLGYKNLDEYQQDMSSWAEWYEINKCDFTNADAERKIETWSKDHDG